MLFDIIFYGIKHQLSVKLISFTKDKEIKFQQYGNKKIYTLYFENDTIVKSEGVNALATMLKI